MAGNSESNKRGAQTKKEKYGPDKHSRDGRLGGRIGTPGYFGKLKATDPEKLRELSSKAGRKGAEARQARKESNANGSNATEDIREGN